MDNIAAAFSKFTEAQYLLAWLKENGLLKDADANPGAIAFNYAIAYESPKVHEAFLACMRLERSDRERVAALPAQARSTSSQKHVDRMLERERFEAEIRAEAKALASSLSLE